MNAARTDPWTTRLVGLLYVLLWPPVLAALFRRSLSGAVIGWWSPRAAVLAALAIVGILAASFVVLSLVRSERRLRGLEILLRRLRDRPMAFHLVAWTPAVAWGGFLVYLAVLQVPAEPLVLLVTADLGLLSFVWLGAVSFIGQPPRQRRLLAMRWALAAGSGVSCVLAIEVAAAVLHLAPYLHWRVNPAQLDVRFHTDDFDVRVRTNRQGLRETKEIPLGTSSGYRVLVLGDSMTFGWGVGDNDAYPARAETQLAAERVELINLGRAGTHPGDYLRLLRHYGLQFRPDLVVVGFHIGNDCPVTPPVESLQEDQVAARLQQWIRQSEPRWWEWLADRSLICRLAAGVGQRAGGLPVAAKPGVRGPLYGEANPLDGIESKVRTPESRQQLQRVKQTGWLALGRQWRVNPWLVRAVVFNPDGPLQAMAIDDAAAARLRPHWRLCHGLLKQIQHVARDAGARTLVLAIPNAHAVSADWLNTLESLGCPTDPRMRTSRTVNDWLRASCRELEIPLVDPLESFRQQQAEQGGLYFAKDDHLTAAGHRLLAEKLAPVLRAELAREEP